MKRSSLTTQTKHCIAVIDRPFRSSLTEVADYFKRYGFVFAMLEHDKDKTNEGVLKTPHVHLIIDSPKRHMLSYYLNLICEVFEKTNNLNELTTDSIEVAVCESFEWNLQYLIHKNDKDKYQYNKYDIITNLTNEQKEEMLNLNVHEKLTTKTIVDIIVNSSSEVEVAFKLGLHDYTLHNKFIGLCIRQGLLGQNIDK